MYLFQHYVIHGCICQGWIPNFGKVGVRLNHILMCITDEDSKYIISCKARGIHFLKKIEVLSVTILRLLTVDK